MASNTRLARDDVVAPAVARAAQLSSGAPGNANNSRGAGGARARLERQLTRGAAGGRAGPRTDTSYRSPTTSRCTWRRRAVRSPTLRSSRSKARAVLWRGRDARRAPHVVKCVAVVPTAASSPARTTAHQDLARRRLRAHHPGAHRLGQAWRCCRAERASSAARTTAPRSCGRSTALSSAPSRWAAGVSVAALPDGVHFVVGLGHGERIQVRLYHVDGTLVHTFEGHTNYVFAVAVTPDGQHIISGSSDKLVKVWSVAARAL